MADLANEGDASESTPQVENAETELPATTSDAWFLVYDEEVKRDYYFNINTEESLWEPPEGLEECKFRRFEELQEQEIYSSAEDDEEETQPNGWHYIDMTGQSQGPFQKEQLNEWRAHFPMNSLFWTTKQMNSGSKEEKSPNKATFLAEILGDEALLERWKCENPGHESRLAPSAADYQQYLENPVNTVPFIQPMAKEPQSTEQAYADAVLAGLPPDDETVQLADLAKQSGTPLKDIVRFMDAAASDGTSQQLIVTDPYSGKMTAVSSNTDESHQLYAEFGSWIDPAKMEEGLKKSAQYRREKLPSLWMKQVGYKKRTLPWQDERYDRDD